MAYYEVIIKPDGSAEIEAFGFKGNSCEVATKHIEEALGVVKERKKKPEYFQRAVQKNRVQGGRRT